MNGDLENGDVEKEFQRSADAANDQDAGEYGNLVRYISNYRDGRRASMVSQEEDKPKKRRFWQSKNKDSEGGYVFETPDEWLTTDMRQGLRSSDVETRRKKTGWNELTTEKENMFLKFLSYFQGPILYGMFLHVRLSVGYN